MRRVFGWLWGNGSGSVDNQTDADASPSSTSMNTRGRASAGASAAGASSSQGGSRVGTPVVTSPKDKRNGTICAGTGDHPTAVILDGSNIVKLYQEAEDESEWKLLAELKMRGPQGQYAKGVRQGNATYVDNDRSIAVLVSPTHCALFDVERSSTKDETSAPTKMDVTLADTVHVHTLVAHTRHGDRNGDEMTLLAHDLGCLLIDPRVEKPVDRVRLAAGTLKGETICAACSTTSGHFALGATDGSVRLYNGSDSNHARTLIKIDDGAVQGLDTSADEEWLAITKKNSVTLVRVADKTAGGFDGFKTSVKDVIKPIKLTVDAALVEAIEDPAPIDGTAKFSSHTASGEQLLSVHSGSFVLVWKIGDVVAGRTTPRVHADIHDRVVDHEFLANARSPVAVITDRVLVSVRSK